jgi:glycosyltransferase involved in cell wall biosynthesis
MEFPLGLAQVQRQLLLAKSLQLEGYEVTVLCRYGIHDQAAGIAPEGVFEGVHYIYCSGITSRPENFIKRNILKVKGLLGEIRHYRHYSKNGQLTGALVSTNNFYNVLFYFLLGKIFGVITVVDNVEYWTSNSNFRGLDRTDKLLYDRFYYYFSDRVICISDFLMNRISSSKRKRAIKIPAITDFGKFQSKNSPAIFAGQKYFLYCGSEHYFDVIDFVIASYESLGPTDIYLALITKMTEKLSKRLEASQVKDKIKVLQNIPYTDLVNMYCFSEALIIPLRNNDQDKARFPHKISEYCASSKPIITNKVGEMCNYFNDTNSYLCNEYEEYEFADKLKQVISDPETARLRSIRSYELGLREFNFSSYSKTLKTLFQGK